MCAVVEGGAHVYTPVCGRYVNSGAGMQPKTKKEGIPSPFVGGGTLRLQLLHHGYHLSLGAGGGGGKVCLLSCLTMYLYTDILEYCT